MMASADVWGNLNVSIFKRRAYKWLIKSYSWETVSQHLISKLFSVASAASLISLTLFRCNLFCLSFYLCFYLLIASTFCPFQVWIWCLAAMTAPNLISLQNCKGNKLDRWSVTMAEAWLTLFLKRFQTLLHRCWPHTAVSQHAPNYSLQQTRSVSQLKSNMQLVAVM